MNKVEFSLFEATSQLKGAFQTIPSRVLDFKELVQYYQSTENKTLSEKILQASGNEQKKLKNERAYFTPYGTFKTRNNQSLINHNAVISIDIDNLSNNEEAINVRDLLAQHESILLCLLSARGKGVKALMRVNATYTPEEQYQQLKHIFRPYLAEYLNIDIEHIDNAQFKLSQPCYFSYDKDMIINFDAKPLKLNFNYKEPELPEFKSSYVPTTASSRIESYMLGVLSNQINKLNSSTARHQQLYKAKYLGQLLHYAPQLENEIVSTYIDAGVRLYGSESMRSNVVKSVTSAIEEGKNQSVNNATIESIIKETQQETKPAPVKASNLIEYNLKTRYIGEDSELMGLIINTIESNRYTAINSNTGTGKTNTFQTIATDISNKVVVVAPLLAIVNQQAKSGGSIIKGNMSSSEIALAQRSRICYCTFASANKLTDLEDRIVIYDESHLLSDRAEMYFDNELKSFYKINARAKKIVFVSATTDNLLRHCFNGLVQINIIESNKPQIKVQPYTYTGTQIDAVLQFISQKRGEGVTVISMLNKEALLQIKDEVRKLGIYTNEEIAKFTASAEDVASEEHILLEEEEIITNKTKLILATNKIGEGVNIKNATKFNMLFVGNKNINYFFQGAGRFRQATELDISVLFGKSFYEKESKNIDAKAEYNSIVNYFKNVEFDVTQATYKGAKRVLSTINWESRAFVELDKRTLNVFEIINQSNKIKEDNYNFNTWSNEIKSRGNVLFKEVKVLDNKASQLTIDERKERKEVKKLFLERIRLMLSSNEAGAVIHEVEKHTKNNQLKKELAEWLLDMPEAVLSVDDKILFHRNFHVIEKYLFNINKLMLMTETHRPEATKLFINDDNWKQSEFKTLCSRLTAVELIKNGAGNLNEQIDLNRINKINKVFEPYFNGEFAQIDKKTMFYILRTQLNYRFRNENKSVVIDKIGVCFVVLYDKFKKEFTLKNVDNNCYQKNELLLEEKEKEVSSNSLTELGLQPYF